jgi:hypothetical protein
MRPIEDRIPAYVDVMGSLGLLALAGIGMAAVERYYRDDPGQTVTSFALYLVGEGAPTVVALVATGALLYALSRLAWILRGRA